MLVAKKSLSICELKPNNRQHIDLKELTMGSRLEQALINLLNSKEGDIFKKIIVDVEQRINYLNVSAYKTNLGLL